MRPIEISDFKAADEFVVEAMMQDGKFKVMIRKHYDVNNGYYIKSSRLHKEQSKDLWCFGSCETITNEYKSNPFICGK